jgi:photosystem II stability/assembly factor-like uncharacterized protein
MAGANLRLTSFLLAMEGSENAHGCGGGNAMPETLHTGSYVLAGIAGYVGRPDEAGEVGVFRRASDGGEWEHVLRDVETHTITVHPQDANIVLAGTTDGVWRSTDHGATFARAQFPDENVQIWSYLIDQRDPNRILAGASPVAVYESQDQGASWQRLPEISIADRAVGPFATRVMRMVQHPTKPDEVYAALEINGVMRTSDFGRSLTDCSDHLVELSRQSYLASKIVTETEAEGMLDGHAITISPAEPDVVLLACRMGLFQSRDQGATWQDKDIKKYSPITYGRDIKISSSEPGTLYAALSVAAASDDGALYKSIDSGETWQRFDKVKVHGTIMSVGLNDKNPDEVYIGARYKGEIFGTCDAGESWTEMRLPGSVKDIYCVTCG